MIVTLQWWHLFMVATIGLMCWCCRPLPGDTFGIGGMFRFFGGVIGSLALWLVYFIGRVVLG